MLSMLLVIVQSLDKSTKCRCLVNGLTGQSVYFNEKVAQLTMLEQATGPIRLAPTQPDMLSAISCGKQANMRSYLNFLNCEHSVRLKERISSHVICFVKTAILELGISHAYQI